MVLTQARRPRGYIGIGCGGKDEMFLRLHSWPAAMMHWQNWLEYFDWTIQAKLPENGYYDDPE